MAAFLQAFRAEYCWRRSDWLKLLDDSQPGTLYRSVSSNARSDQSIITVVKRLQTKKKNKKQKLKEEEEEAAIRMMMIKTVLLMMTVIVMVMITIRMTRIRRMMTRGLSLQLPARRCAGLPDQSPPCSPTDNITVMPLTEVTGELETTEIRR